MEQNNFFTIPEITNYIAQFLSLLDLNNLRLCNKEYADTFKYDQSQKNIKFKRSLNFREDIFARPYYPLSKLKEIYEAEYNKYSDGFRVDVYWQNKIIGFVRYKKGYNIDKVFGSDSDYVKSLLDDKFDRIPSNWNGYFFQNEIKYDEDNYISLQKYKGCDLPKITFAQGNVLGFDHCNGWDFEQKNYTTLEMVKNEVIAMYHCYNEILPFSQYQ